MIRLLAYLLLAQGPQSNTVDPNPAKLAPSAEVQAKAEKLVADLASASYEVRAQANRDLAGMGRLALKAIDKALLESDNAEVQSRCASLRPAMAEEDLAVRLAAFRADAAGRFEHRLPGWDKFRKTTGNTAAAREIFSKMLENDATLMMIRSLNGPASELHPMIYARRMELYNRQTGRERRVENGRIIYANTNNPPTTQEVAGLLFVENQIEPAIDRRTTSYIQYLFTNATMRAAATDPKNDILRKLLAEWCDRRADTAEASVAMAIAASLDLKELDAAKFAKKVIETAGTPFQRAQAICTLAKAGGKNEIPTLEKQFDNKTVCYTTMVMVDNVQKRQEIQVRDVALAMCVLAAGEKIEDYGLATTNRAYNTATAAMKYSYYYYHFPTDEKRDEGFKKWAARKSK